MVPVRQLSALPAEHRRGGLRDRAGPSAVLAVRRRRARPARPGEGHFRPRGRGDGRRRLPAGPANVRPPRGDSGVFAGRARGHSHPAQPLLRRRHDRDPLRCPGRLLHAEGRLGRPASGLDTRRRLRRPRAGDEGEPSADLPRARHGARRLRPGRAQVRQRPRPGRRRRVRGHSGAGRGYRGVAGRALRRAAVLVPGLVAVLRVRVRAVRDGAPDQGLPIHAPVRRYHPVLVPLPAALGMGSGLAPGPARGGRAWRTRRCAECARVWAPSTSRPASWYRPSY